jgi:CHAD domain-containing protein
MSPAQRQPLAGQAPRRTMRSVPGAASVDGGDVWQIAQVSAATVVHVRLREQVAELNRRQAQVRRDDPDAVHQMRVAARRLRSALATFRPLLDRRASDSLRGELRWLSRALASAREADAMRARLSAAIAREPAELVRGPVASRVDEDLLSAYRTGHARAIEAMDSSRFHSLLEDLEALVTEPPWTPLAKRPAREVLPEQVRRDWQRLRRRVRAASQTPHGPERYERLHEARKAAKRLRYAAETFAAVNSRHARRLATAGKRVQSVLGQHHDGVVTQQALRRLAAQAHSRGEDTFTYGLLHAREETRAAAVEAEFAAAWKHTSRKSLPRWLS